MAAPGAGIAILMNRDMLMPLNVEDTKSPILTGGKLDARPQFRLDPVRCRIAWRPRRGALRCNCSLRKTNLQRSTIRPPRAAAICVTH
jgi:hypothetical protein